MANEKVVVSEQAAPMAKTHTKWEALEQAKLIPVRVMCDGYRPFHAFNLGCHTKMQINVEQWINHVKGGHGGGFMMKFRKGDKPWPGWRQVAEAGLESVDFRCEICDQQIPFNAMHILKHMRAHNGKMRRVLPGGVYNITFSIGTPEPTETEAFEEGE